MKGLIVEKESESYIVLTSTGAYKKIKGFTKMNIGQEVNINHTFSMAKAALLAAALLVIIVLAETIFKIPSQTQVYAYVTLDINPSVEFVIDADYAVFRAYPKNDEAEEILGDIEYLDRGIDGVLADFTEAAIARRHITKDKENHPVWKLKLRQSLQIIKHGKK